jgi:serine protease AprX
MNSCQQQSLWQEVSKMMTSRTRRTTAFQRSRMIVPAVIGVASLLAGTTASTVAAASAPNSGSKATDLTPTSAGTEELIVRAAPGHMAEVAAELDDLGAHVTRTLPIIDAVAVEVAAGHRNEVASLPGVLAAVSDQVLTPMDKDSKDKSKDRNNKDRDKRGNGTSGGNGDQSVPAAPPTTAAPTTTAPTTTAPTTTAPTTVAPTTAAPTTVAPTTVAPISASTAPASSPSAASESVTTVPSLPTAASATAFAPASAAASTSTSTTVPAASTNVSQSPATTSDEKSEGAKSEKSKSNKESKDSKDSKDKAKEQAEKDKAKDKADDDSEKAEKAADEKDGSSDPGSVESIARVTGARRLWKQGITGAGVDVALIDTGIASVPGAPASVNGADLSLDAGAANLRFLDGYGHGTHMAGIIAGRDAGVTDPAKAKGKFVGIAPGARIVNVKVGAMDGSVHTSQVVAAFDWVVQNKNANGMNIRVINLSYGAPASSNWRLDPLAWAAEVATARGIVVVAAAGNDGAGHELASPAYSPRILAVGATEIETSRGGRGDYAVAPYTSTGSRRRPDVFVPGSHVISLRVKGSYVDTFKASANVSDQLTRGSGTSQATAVTSGLAALLVQAFPAASPDQIRALMVESAEQSRGSKDITGIESLVDVKRAYKAGLKKLPAVPAVDPFAGCGPTWCRGAGDGTNQAVVDWAQAAWNGSAWNGSAWNGSAWNGSAWNGSAWSGSAWNGSAWSGSAWSGSAWSGSAWNGSVWNGSAWSGSAWSGSAWSGSAWNGSAWNGSAWSGSAWSGSAWSGSAWSGSAWSSQWAD